MIFGPGGMRVAIEYGQPLAGTAVMEAQSQNNPCRRHKTAPRVPPGRRQNTAKTLLSQTALHLISFHFTCILLHFRHALTTHKPTHCADKDIL